MTSNYNFTSISLAIEFYGSIFIGSFGVLTNTLNLIVSSREKVRKTNAGFYSTFISIFSLLAIVVKFLDYFPESIGQHKLLLIFLQTCVLNQYFTSVFYWYFLLKLYLFFFKFMNISLKKLQLSVLRFLLN